MTLILAIWPWVKVIQLWYIIKIQHGSKELWTGHGFWVYVHCDLEIWPWVKVISHPWVMDNNCVKYYPDPTVLARTRILGMCALGYITIKGHLVCHLGCKTEVFRFFQKLFFCNLQWPRFVKLEGCFAISMRKIFFPYFVITNVKWLRTLQVANFFNK